MNHLKLLAILMVALSAVVTQADEDCNFFLKSSIADLFKYQKKMPFKFRNLFVSSLEDATKSTGATLFYFPEGANVSFDSRGGSVASSETTLLSDGSYSNNVDAIVFAGGSTMGLSAGDGVRQALFKMRMEKAGEFDFIPSVPTAVVYDFGGRIHKYNDKLVYPDQQLGGDLMKHLKKEFTIGRSGAGISTSMNKQNVDGGPTVWGGQGAAYAEYPWGKVFVAVVVNALGDVRHNGKSVSQLIKKSHASLQTGPQAKQNTTLSIVITDLPLDRTQLKRLSVQVHTSMGESIFPFHTYHDGDINFAASISKSQKAVPEDIEMLLAMESSKLMQQAILQASEVANGIKVGTVSGAKHAGSKKGGK